MIMSTALKQIGALEISERVKRNCNENISINVALCQIPQTYNDNLITIRTQFRREQLHWDSHNDDLTFT